jgi:hypothetical protein
MTPKPTQRTAAKPPDKNLRSNLTLSIPTALLADIDVLALQAGLSRADTIEKILTACTFQGYGPKAPRACPRGHRRPCDPPPVPNPGAV